MEENFVQENGKKSKKQLIWILAATVLFLGLFIGAFGAYINDYYKADDVAQWTVSNPPEDVEIREVEGERIEFIPEQVKAGMIFYPGGKVEYSSYAPLCEKIASRGILVVLFHEPFNLAILDIDAADGIKEEFPDVEHWFVGGHSLGGAIASSYFAENEDQYEGLILLAAYSMEDISKTDAAVLSIYGSEDKVMDMEKYRDALNKLPIGYQEYVIDGGCHSYFGNYGIQDGDGEPSITEEEQQERTALLVGDFVDSTLLN